MLAHFQLMKAEMNKVRESERDKLTKVTLESNAAIKEVKRHKDKVGTGSTISDSTIVIGINNPHLLYIVLHSA